MIVLPSGAHVWLACGYTDMRKGMDGLAMLAQQVLAEDPFSGALFAFRGKRGGLIKLLWFDIRGWINYYSHFYKSALYPTLRRIDVFLLRWARRKFKRLRQQPKGARNWLARVVRSSPDLFAHWPLLYGQGRTLGAV